jgi:hypothetical protein
MLAVPCPACGAPCRVNLETPDVVACEKCGRRGAPPEAASARIRGAAEVLARSDDRERQLHGFARSIASGRGLAIYLVVVGISAAWAMVLVVGMQAPMIAAHLGVLGLPAVAAVLSFGVALPGLLGIRRKQKFLRQLLAAAPPLRAGEAAACRVCGGPVEGLGVVRCSYCRSDNVVDHRVMDRAGEVQAGELQDLSSALSSHSMDLRETGARGLIVTFTLSYFLIPYVTARYGDELLDQVRWSVAADVRYELRARYGDACLTQKPGSEGALLEQVHPSWVVGKSRRGHTAIGVAHHPVYGDVAVHQSSMETLEGYCVYDARAVPPPPAPRPPPPTTGPVAEALATRLTGAQRAKRCVELVQFEIDCHYKIDLPGAEAGAAERKRFVDARVASCVGGAASYAWRDEALGCFIALTAPDAGGQACRGMPDCLVGVLRARPPPLQPITPSFEPK